MEHPSAKQIKEHLERRLEFWKNENYDDLFREALTIQKRLKNKCYERNEESTYGALDT